jgi:outer membrane protein
MKFLIKTSLIFYFFLFSTFAYSLSEIAYIDLDVVLKETELGKSILVNLNKINDKNVKDLKNKEEEIKSLENEIKSKKNILSEEKFNKEVNNLRDKINTFRNEKDKMVNEFSKIKNDKVNDFFKRINPIIQDYMNKNSINILLERKNIFIGKMTSEITDDIILLINKNLN